MQPGVVSITQSTELGTLYTRRGDGRARGLRARARDAPARRRLAAGQRRRRARRRAAARSRRASGPTSSASAGRRSGCSRPRLVVVLDPSLPDALPYLRKQSMQLASKMRFVVGAARGAADRRSVAARGEPCQRDGAAARGRRRGPRRRSPRPCEANAVFAILPPEATAGSSRTSGSTCGTSTPARSAGCARGTRRRPTSTRSPPRSCASRPLARRWPRRSIHRPRSSSPGMSAST